MRREIQGIKDLVRNEVASDTGDMMMESGSYREGFRLKGSDLDFMFWPNHCNIIWDLYQAQNYDLNRKTLILCDCSESPPGFALLELLTPIHSKYLQNACMRINGRLFISSSKHRQFMCSSFFSLPDSKEHGPCSSGFISEEEYDIAHCFVSDFWPPPASKWIDRCYSWPQSHIVDDIVRNGCHFVAIGHKLGYHVDKEWRISFSLAEQKLVYSMNHCQFLTYGLLKLFLKECINNGLSDEDKLLCSYHMKTAVFWVIQQNTMPYWFPQNLLQCFWVCFKLILKWVYEGVCPNFFIPENNMFLSNIYGEAQKNLFIRLHALYEKGLASLLHSPSISSYVISVLQNPRQSVCTDEHSLISEMKFEVHLFHEIDANRLPKSRMKLLNALGKLIILPLTQYQVLMLQCLTADVFQHTAFMLQIVPLTVYTSTSVNKWIYSVDKTSCHMLKLTAKFGCISDMLYIAMYYYKTFRYQEALTVIEVTKVKLTQPYVLYRGPVDVERYSEAVGGQSWSRKMRHVMARNISLNNEICYINELVPEQKASLQCRMPILLISPYVLLYMLQILCYRHVDPLRAQTALDALQDLVHHDQGMYTDVLYKDISWEILGICQQVTGNLEDALHSYQQSLIHASVFKIQIATLMRIQEIMGLIQRV